MTDKKKTIKTIALVLISFVFLFMLYTTFFKAKKNSTKTAVKKQPPKIVATLPETVTPPQTQKAAVPGSGSDPGHIKVPAKSFKPDIPRIFKPFISVKAVFKMEKEKAEAILAESLKKKALTKILPDLSEQEKNSISQDLDFKGSILSSSNNAVAIINNEFIHVGDSVNGYKVASISEQQVTIDTGRGTIILEIMTHE
jgi:hypothetical protein